VAPVLALSPTAGMAVPGRASGTHSAAPVMELDADSVKTRKPWTTRTHTHTHTTHHVVLVGGHVLNGRCSVRQRWQILSGHRRVVGHWRLVAPGIVVASRTDLRRREVRRLLLCCAGALCRKKSSGPDDPRSPLYCCFLSFEQTQELLTEPHLGKHLH
jgi:hypothetical protein